MKTWKCRGCEWEGCEWEFLEAIRLQDDEGLYFATSIDRELEDMEHFNILMVDGDGCIIEW